MNLYTYILLTEGRDSSVGIETQYGMVKPGIKMQVGGRISAFVQTGPGHTQSPL
jgi:hypothetical protein